MLCDDAAIAAAAAADNADAQASESSVHMSVEVPRWRGSDGYRAVGI